MVQFGLLSHSLALSSSLDFSARSSILVTTVSLVLKSIPRPMYVTLSRLLFFPISLPPFTGNLGRNN